MIKEYTTFRSIIFGDNNHTELMMIGHRLEMRDRLKDAMGEDYFNIAKGRINEAN